MHEATSREEIETVKVLLIEDNPDDARIVESMLSEAQGAMEVRFGVIEVCWVDGLAGALDLLSRQNFDAVLVDLQLPDSTGLETLAEVRSAAASAAIVVLTGFDDDGQALAAIKRGAQDYVAKDQLDGRLLSRTIRHAIERKRAEVELRRHAREVEAGLIAVSSRGKTALKHLLIGSVAERIVRLAHCPVLVLKK
ncbi:hypothetical protein LCGC14_2677750 [marine sediment metagenome]|uniref:Response regulatory domain-containing protein n=1 Tax=marine sediment metagenome TaxID=412755 RepID=A0A0F9CE33_9ZZZZ